MTTSPPKSTQCEWCQRSFSTAGNLKRHQDTARFCLELRGKAVKKETVVVSCRWCDKTFGFASNLRVHVATCKVRRGREREEMEHEKTQAVQKSEKMADELRHTKRLLEMCRRDIRNLEEETGRLQTLNVQKDDMVKQKDVEIDQLKEEIISLKLELSEKKGLAEGLVKGYESRPAVPVQINNNNATTNVINPRLANIPTSAIRPFTLDLVQEDIDKGLFTRDEYTKGITGLVNFIRRLIVVEKDGETHRNYACTDSSRSKFHRLIESKEWQKDDGAQFLNGCLDILAPEIEKHHNVLLEKRKQAHIAEDKHLYDAWDEIIQIVRPIFRGAKLPSGPDREQLFEEIRSKVRKLASV